MTKIRNVTFILQNFTKFLKNVEKRKKIEKIQMVSKKSINSFEIEKKTII